MNPHGNITLLDATAPTRWRNGGGQTRELLVWPSAADWRVRFSVATIGQDGEFSAYAGVVRWFAVLQGAGVTLQFGDASQALTTASPPFMFDGAAAPRAVLTQGPTDDVNLMLRGTPGSLVDVGSAPVKRPFALFTATEGIMTANHQTCPLVAGALLQFKQARGSAEVQYAGRGWWIFVDEGSRP